MKIKMAARDIPPPGAAGGTGGAGGERRRKRTSRHGIARNRGKLRHDHERVGEASERHTTTHKKHTQNKHV